MIRKQERLGFRFTDVHHPCNNSTCNSTHDGKCNDINDYRSERGIKCCHRVKTKVYAESEQSTNNGCDFYPANDGFVV